MAFVQSSHPSLRLLHVLLLLEHCLRVEHCLRATLTTLASATATFISIPSCVVYCCFLSFFRLLPVCSKRKIAVFFFLSKENGCFCFRKHNVGLGPLCHLCRKAQFALVLFSVPSSQLILFWLLLKTFLILIILLKEI